MITIILNTIIATVIAWFLTTLGSAIVFFFKKVDKTLLDCCFLYPQELCLQQRSFLF